MGETVEWFGVESIKVDMPPTTERLPRPVCPICGDDMVRVWVELADAGTMWTGFMCPCYKDEPPPADEDESEP